MGKVVYQDCIVLKMLRWKDDKFIVTLLGKQWCLFNALWSLPKTKKVRKPAHPELFQNIQATLQHHQDGIHRLRDYRETKSPNLESLESYLGLNLMARYFMVNCDESPDAGPWHIWKRYQHHELFKLEHSLNLFTELCYHNGTWPAGDFCESCNAPLHQKAYLDTASLVCSNCQDRGHLLAPESLNWIQQRFYHAQVQPPHERDKKNLVSWLKKRLPDHTFRDRIMRKLWQNYQHQIFSKA